MSGSEIRTAKQARQVLNLPVTAGLDDIRRAFRAAVRKAHPDRGGDAEALRRVIDAHRLLIDLHGARLHLSPVAVEQPRIQPRPRPVPTPPVLPLEISVELAVRGGARAVKLPDGRRGRLKLPAGLRPGDTVRLATPDGPLLMSVVYARGEYDARGGDLWAELPVSPRLLEDGGPVEVDTPHGRRTVTIAPGATTLRLQGQGLPARGDRPQGHLFLRLKADPSLGRSRASEMLRRFAASWAA